MGEMVLAAFRVRLRLQLRPTASLDMPLWLLLSTPRASFPPAPEPLLSVLCSSGPLASNTLPPFLVELLHFKAQIKHHNLAMPRNVKLLGSPVLICVMCVTQEKTTPDPRKAGRQPVLHHTEMTRPQLGH